MASFKRVVLTERDNYQAETKNNTVKKQLEKFDNSYTSKKLNELYNEFDAITFNAPSISSSLTTKTNAFVAQKNEVGFKTKLYLTGAAIVLILLAFLAIYNIFVINSINGGINFLQEEISLSTNDYNALNGFNSQLKNPTSISQRMAQMGFSEISSNSIVSVPLIEATQVPTYNTSTNWFNELCNFIGGLLGG